LATAVPFVLDVKCEYLIVIDAVLCPINSIIAFGAVPFIASQLPKQ
jgi:hypothetical protein